MSTETRARDCYLTPQWLVDLCEDFWGRADLDPFWHPKALTRARTVIDERRGGDAYRDSWVGKTAVVNGPYSGDRPANTARRCLEMRHVTGIEIVNICVAAVGSGYWRSHVWPHANAIAFLGRVAFVAGEDIYDDRGVLVQAAGTTRAGNRHEIAGVYLGSNARGFARVFSRRSHVVWR